MSRRDRGRGGGLFSNAEPEDEVLPELDELLHNRPSRPPRGSRRPNSATRAATAYLLGPRRTNLRPRVWPTRLRVGAYSLLFLLSLAGFGAGLTNAVSGYSDAGAFASAPACAAGVNPASTGQDCVGTLNLVAEYGVYENSTEDAIDLALPPAGSQNLVTASFPGNAAFEHAVGDGPSVVRAEFWKGQLVTLTAGARGSTVTTHQNPNNAGGSGVGVALISLAITLLSVLLFIGIRVFRLRWLRPGLALQLTVSGLMIGVAGLFIAGCCLVAQPEWVLRIGVVMPIVTVGLTGLLWWLFIQGHGSRARRAYRLR